MSNEDVFVGFMVFIVAVLLVVCFWASKNEAEEWARFRLDHKCRVIEHIRGSTDTGIVFNGNGQPSTVVMSEPSKTRWLCDDGVVYTR